MRIGTSLLTLWIIVFALGGGGWIPELFAIAGAETMAADPPAAAKRRTVDGIPVPVFGWTLDSIDNAGFRRFDTFFDTHLVAWPGPEADAKATAPFAYHVWAGPYKNAAGQRWVEQINAWHRDGLAAGLNQDTFRSYDNNHSKIRLVEYPQMKSVAPIPNFGSPWENIFRHRVTMGVQSYGSEGRSIIEAQTNAMLRGFFASKATKAELQRMFRTFYENNFLFAAPAVNSYKPDKDAFSILSPYYLHSIGASGTDSQLIKPLVLASAALPPDLKTRILRQGLFVPTMMYLFKSHIAGEITAPEAHLPAYSLPAEAKEDFEGDSPFLDGLLEAAHHLSHIPPVCRIRILHCKIENDEGQADERPAYYEDSTYAFAGALRHGQNFVIDLDLRFSWTDENRPIRRYEALLLRGNADIKPLNEEQSKLQVRIPWNVAGKDHDFRTDILLLVHDGAYYSAPAYLSVRHIHRLDPLILGIKPQ